MMPRLALEWVSASQHEWTFSTSEPPRRPRVSVHEGKPKLYNVCVAAAGGRKAQYDMLSRSMVRNKDDTRRAKEENKSMQKKLKSLKMVRPRTNQSIPPHPQGLSREADGSRLAQLGVEREIPQTHTVRREGAVLNASSIFAGEHGWNSGSDWRRRQKNREKGAPPRLALLPSEAGY